MMHRLNNKNNFYSLIRLFIDDCLLGKRMNGKPDVLVLLAGLVALGALLTGFMTPDEVHSSMIVSENLIR